MRPFQSTEACLPSLASNSWDFLTLSPYILVTLNLHLQEWTVIPLTCCSLSAPQIYQANCYPHFTFGKSASPFCSDSGGLRFPPRQQCLEEMAVGCSVQLVPKPHPLNLHDCLCLPPNPAHRRLVLAFFL